MHRFIVSLLWAAAVAVSLSGAELITTQPVSIHAVAGQAASLHVTVTGPATITYQWRKFGVPIPGATSPTLAFPAAAFSDAGFYDVLVTDGVTVATSVGVEVRVSPPFYPNVLRARTSFAPRMEISGGQVATLLVAPDGKYYAGGSFLGVNATDRRNLVRFKADSTLDPTFQPPLLVGGRVNAVNAVARQADGKLIVAGDFVAKGTKDHHDMVRLNDDGSIDPTFELPDQFDFPPEDVAIQADGKILVVGGFKRLGTTTLGGIARLNTDGRLDTTFDTGSGFSPGGGAIIRVQSTGRILVAGGFSTFNGSSARYLIRLQTTGQRDSTFVTTLVYYVAAVHVLPDDRLLIGSDYSGLGGPTVLRLSVNGTTELVFDSSINATMTSSFPGLAVQPDGKVIAITRQRDVNFRAAGAVVRFNADGTLDSGFTRNNTVYDGPYAVALLNDGDIVASGAFDMQAGFTPGSIVRLNPDGSRDATATPAFFNLGRPRVVLPAAGGGWFVGGDFSRVNGVSVPGLVRLTGAGAVDPVFVPALPARTIVNSLVQQGDGRIVACGSFGGSAADPDFSLARLEVNGVRDTSYVPALPTGATGQQLALLPDGSLVVSATTALSAPRVLDRVLPDGTIDPTYASALRFNNAPDMLYARPNGKLFVGEPTLSANGVNSGLFRLNRDGTVDSGFVPSSIGTRQVSVVAEQADGRLVVGGLFPGATGFDDPRNITRLLADGARDPAFASTGSYGTLPRHVLLHTNGDILVTGLVFAPTRPGLARFVGAGTLDPRFVILNTANDGEVWTSNYTVDGGILVGGWSVFDNVLTYGLALLEPVPEPLIIGQPQTPPATQAGGSSVSISVDALVNGTATYQWQMQYTGVGSGGAAPFATPMAGTGFVDIPGANSATLVIPVPQQFHNGMYRAVITANGTSVTSSAAAVSVAAATPSPFARVLNLSARALVQTGDNVLIPGFVVSGSASKKLLIRAVGPTLGTPPFNLTGVLPDPRIVLKRRNPTTLQFVDVANNDNWGTNPNFAEIKQTAADLGAFGIPDASADAALLLDLIPGEYTVIADGVASASGIAIVELYDADATGTGSRLANISNRGFVGVGANVMIPGFVVSSEGPKTFLIRAVGPTLGIFGVAGTMADPKLTVYRSNSPAPGDTEILQQDNWGENPDAGYTAQIAALVLAFPLANGSKDAAFVVTLPPGLYTAHGKSADGVSTGVVLVEVYVVE